MNITRRTFIGGVAAAMSGALLRRGEALANASPEIQAASALWVEATRYGDEFLAGLVIEGHGAFTADDVSLEFVTDTTNVRRHPTTVRIGRLVGSYADLLALYELGNIEHQLDALLVCTWRHQPHIAPPEHLLSWRLHRPVLTSLGMATSTQPTRFDAEGHNGGQDIVLKPHERTAIVTDAQLMLVNLPEALSHEMAQQVWQQSRSRPYSDPYGEIEAAYAERQRTQTPEERAEEERRVQAYANANRDQTAWDRAAEQLTDFDPQQFRRSRPAT